MKKMVSIGIVSLLVIGGFLGVMNLTSEYASAYITHDPIYIDGNADFTPANGVKSGSGTQSDPYLIEGWDIKAMCEVAGKFCLFLEDIKPLRSRVPFRGRQGIFNVPDELIKENI